MTGMADNVGMRHGMDLGADDYLPKPFTIDGLHAAVEARLKKAQTVRDEAERKLAHLRDNISLMLPHEMHTPLNGILSNADMLADVEHAFTRAEIAEIGQEIHSSAQRLQRLVENYLNYAKLELVAADPKNVNALRVGLTEHPAELIKKHATAQAMQAGRLPDLVCELADLPISMAGEYLGKVVDELTQNAFKFSETDSPVRVTLSEAFNAVTLTFKDLGSGFSTEQITRIGAYMQFDRKMQEQQGQGLGLVIAKRLVELHGGKLEIASEKKSGATVLCRFPKPKTG
jgi:signal transduction histidine kinase